MTNRMSETFYCCQEFADFIAEEDFTAKEVAEEYDFHYCPFCSYNLNMLQ